MTTLSMICPLCPWSARQQVDDVADASRIDSSLCLALRDHLWRAHVEPIARARQLHREGATHECEEWWTATGICAVCEARR